MPAFETAALLHVPGSRPKPIPPRRRPARASPAAPAARLVRLATLAALLIPLYPLIYSPAIDAAEANDQQLSASLSPAEEVDALGDSLGFVVMPVPVKNPTVGTGLSLVTLFTYGLDGDRSPPSSTALAGGYTDSGSWAAGLKQSLYWGANRYRATISLGRGEAELSYFGNASGVDLSDNPIRYRLGGLFFSSRVMMRLVDAWYAGVQASYLDASTNAALSGIPLPELNTTLLGLGPLVNFDSRDDLFYPTRGTYAEFLALIHDRDLGSDFRYRKYKFFINHYRQPRDSLVLALRVSGVLTDGRVPFFDSPSLDLRGFPAGRYQDEQMLAAQAEARWRVAGRWTLIGFAGAGKVAGAIGDFGDASTVVSGGAGIRFLASRSANVNIGIDYAVSSDDSAVYFRVGEAF